MLMIVTSDREGYENDPASIQLPKHDEIARSIWDVCPEVADMTDKPSIVLSISGQ